MQPHNVPGNSLMIQEFKRSEDEPMIHRVTLSIGSLDLDERYPKYEFPSFLAELGNAVRLGQNPRIPTNLVDQSTRDDECPTAWGITYAEELPQYSVLLKSFAVLMESLRVADDPRLYEVSQKFAGGWLHQVAFDVVPKPEKS